MNQSTALIDQTLGYLWFNACVFSQFHQRGYQSPLEMQAQTQVDFYEQTKYDILTNIYELIQAYGPHRINLVAFEEGFQDAYAEKRGYSQFEQLGDYLDCWETSCRLGGLPF